MEKIEQKHFSSIAFFVFSFSDSKVIANPIWANDYSNMNIFREILEDSLNPIIFTSNLQDNPKSFLVQSVYKEHYYSANFLRIFFAFEQVQRPIGIIFLNSDQYVINFLSVNFQDDINRFLIEIQSLAKSEIDAPVLWSIKSFKLILNQFTELFKRFSSTREEIQNTSCRPPEDKKAILFGFQSSFFNSKQDHENTENLILSLFQTGIFYNCIYSILSGKTLIIKSEKTCYESVAEQLQTFVPRFRSQLFKKIESISPINSIQFAIVFTQKVLEGDLQMISLLDLDNRIYKGQVCPPKSFVRNSFFFNEKMNEESFFSNCHRILRKISNRLVLNLKPFSSETDLLKKMNDAKVFKNFGAKCTLEDIPIFRYWYVIMMDKTSKKPILPKNKPLFSTVITIF